MVRQYSKAGHSVKMANSSGTEKLKSLALETGASALGLTFIMSHDPELWMDCVKNNRKIYESDLDI